MENLEKKLGPSLEFIGIMIPMITSLGVGFYCAYTGNNIQSNPLPLEIAIGATLGSIPLAVIGEKMNAKNAFDDKMVGIVATCATIYSPICYGIGYGVGKLFN